MPEERRGPLARPQMPQGARVILTEDEKRRLNVAGEYIRLVIEGLGKMLPDSFFKDIADAKSAIVLTLAGKGDGRTILQQMRLMPGDRAINLPQEKAMLVNSIVEVSRYTGAKNKKPDDMKRRFLYGESKQAEDGQSSQGGAADTPAGGAVQEESGPDKGIRQGFRHGALSGH